MLKSTNQPLSKTYKLALLDLDGVVYRGKNLWNMPPRIFARPNPWA